jgi:hypothetical protein
MNITLGARVSYHHRAAVARYRRPFEGSKERRWTLHEGASKTAYIRGAEPFTSLGQERDRFWEWPAIHARNGELNKTIMVWPEEGTGVVIGRVRRGIGISSRGYGHGEDYEPGYFDPISWHELFAVRHELRGVEYILVPEWAASPA